MRKLGKSDLTAVCLASLAVFMFQTFSCFAEGVGFFPCFGQSASLIDDEATTCPEESSESPGFTCCHMHCSLAVFFSEQCPIGLLKQFSDHHGAKDSSLAEGPVRKIDHPPQLS